MPHQALTFLVDVARLALWLVILAAIFVPLERLFALRRSGRRRKGLWQDLALYFLNSLLPAVVLGIPMAMIVALTHRIVPGDYYAWVDALPLWVKASAAFIIGDIGFYWAHRWTHEVPLLWRFHAVHHRPEHMDWLVNTRTHPVDLILIRLSGLAPLYALGLANTAQTEGGLIAVGVVLIGTIWGFFLHANVRWRLRWLQPIVATPHFHHWHHTRSGEINRNFAAMLPLLDRLFGTAHPHDPAFPQDYGVRDIAPDEPATPPAPLPERSPHLTA